MTTQAEGFYGKSAVTDAGPRCWRCRRKLAEHVTRPWLILCSRCKAQNANGQPPADAIAHPSAASETSEPPIP